MKKLFTLALLACAGSAFAQLPVSTQPSLKNALIEEFTGINCVYCPDGHKIAAQIVAANPNRAFAVNIHTGGFATPSAGQPDFRTTDGTAIAAIPTMGITGYPQGAVNRAFYPTTATAMAMSRGSWTAAVNAQLTQSAYANIAGAATLDINTRVLTVDIEVYYTANSPAATNKLTVMLLQNNINGPQTGGAQFNPTMVNPDGSYRHMKALRDVITTGATGQDITPTTQGSLVTQTLTYTIPATIGTLPVDLSNLEILAVVSEGVTNVINVAKAPISYTGFTTTNNAAVTSLNSIEDICVNTLSPTIQIKNNGSAAVTSADITYSINGGTPSTYNYTGSINPLGTASVTLPAISFTLGASNTLNVDVTTVNGGTDDDPSDNSGNTTFNSTTSTSPTVNLTLKILQDRYGDEITWKFFDDAGTQLANGGPYAQLSANGTLMNTHNVVVPASGCYRVVVYDSYGDGINSGYGAGNITLLDGYGAQVYYNNGVFASEAARNFQVTGNTNTTGIQENSSLTSLNIYPNPAQSTAMIAFDLKETAQVNIRLTNSLGQVISYERLGQKAFGSHNHLMDVSALPAGLYLAEIETGNGTSFVKFTVAH